MLADVIPRIAAELQAAPADYTERPSSAGPERCIRQMVYHAAGIARQPFPGRAILIFDDSSWHEVLTKDWIRKTSYTLHSEQMAVNLPGVLFWRRGQTRRCSECERQIRAKHPVPDPEKVSPAEFERALRALNAALPQADIPAEDLHGHPDGILTDLARADFLFEHKAINHFSYDRIWKGDWPLDNLTQLAIYMRATQLLAPELTKGLLLLKNKNTAQYMELFCTYDHASDSLMVTEIVRSPNEHRTLTFLVERIVELAVAKFAEIENYRQRAVLPARPFPYGTEYPCGYCGWAGHCWGSFEQEFAAMAEGAKLADDVVALCEGIIKKRDQVKDMTAEAKELRQRVAALLKAQEQDIIDACAYYFQADSDAKELDRELGDLRAGIRRMLWHEGTRQGRAGDYSVTLALRKRSGYFVEPTQWEQVDIRKVKPPEATKGGRRGQTDPGPGPAGGGEPGG